MFIHSKTDYSGSGPTKNRVWLQKSINRKRK